MVKPVRRPGRKALFKDVKREEEKREEKEMVEGEEMIGEEREDAVSRRDESAAEYGNRQLRRLLKALEAFRKGDITIRLTKEREDIYGQLVDSYNSMAEMIGGVSMEVSRVARVAGTEGKLTERARVEGVAGAWKDIVDTLNGLIDSIAKPTLEVGRILDNISKGNLAEKFAIPVAGDFKMMSDTINKTLNDLNTFAGEVTRVAKTVGVEGKLGVQAEVPGVAGIWKELTDNVNMLTGNLTSQVRNIAEVTTGVAQGDLTKKITVDVKGEILELKNTINKMVDNLNLFGGEVTRVAKEVGVEGKLGGQAMVPGVAGTWKELTDNVNMLAANLTNQVRNIAEVTTGVANGDLTRKITVDVKGEILQLKDTINEMVDNLSTFADEVTRVAREVGTEGKLGGQAEVPGVAGTWKDLTDNVNTMAGNLTSQVREIATVTTGVAKGDLTQKITVKGKGGEVLELANTINTMVDNLSTFGDEVTRVAREVGIEGKLGGQAKVPGVAGTWKELTANVNMLAANLTSQVRNIAEVTTGVANGDLTRKITVEVKGEVLQLKETINKMVDNLNTFGSEVTRVAKEVGIEGKLGGQAKVPGVAGTWKELTDNVNMLAGNLTSQVRNIAEVTTGVANGDLTKKITVDVKGEILQLKDTINKMVDNLNTFAGEVTRVAREVGVEGKLGGQAKVPGVAGTWKDLTDNVNTMASNLTDQVREVAKVVTAISEGNLTQKVAIEAKGEVLALAETINQMVDDLNRLAGEVSRVAKVAGVEGKLEERAEVPGVLGSWKDVVDTLNSLIESIATPVLEISRVVTAISEGDLTQKFEMEARGDIRVMTDNLNTSIDSLNNLLGQIRSSADIVASTSQGVASSGTEMNTTTTQVASSVQQIAKGAQDQAQKADVASKSIEQISKAAADALARAEEVNKAAAQSNESAKTGIQTVSEAVKSMMAISDAAEKSKSVTDTLVLRSEEIAKTLGVITDIASQTNLLALNAAIEAARAGEAGRGFAVVAEEVRKLAEGSRRSAGEIGELVKSVQKETSGAAEAISVMTENVSAGREATDKSSKALEDIVSAMQQTLSSAQAISETAKTQRESIEQVVKTMEEVSTIAEETASGSEQSSSSAQELTSAMQELTTSGQELASIAAGLQEAVGAFKLGEVMVEEKAAVVKPKEEVPKKKVEARKRAPVVVKKAPPAAKVGSKKIR